MLKIISKSIIVLLFSFIVVNIISYVIISNQSLSYDINKKTIGADAYDAIALSKKYHPDKNIVILGTAWQDK